MQTIYIDVLIGVNVYINYLLLILTARLAGCRQVRTRIVLGAVFGALSSCAILLEIPSNVISVAIKVITAAVMTLISFEIKNRKDFLKTVSILTAVTFAFAGAMIGIQNVMSTDNIAVSNYFVYLDISPLYLIFITLVCYVLLSVCSKLLARKTQQNSACRVTIGNEGKSITLDAVLDTGNTLTEPFSGLPVVVVNEKSIFHILPNEIKGFTPEDPKPSKNIRLIPYTSVGGTGLLKGFMPEYITVEKGTTQTKTKNVYIAVMEKRNDIPALINPDILA